MDYVITNGGGKLKALEGDNNISITSAAGGNNTVVTGDGDDTVNVEDRDETEEKRYYNNIDVGDGNNYINNSDVELSTISAGSSNDTIITGGGDGYYNPTSINAGAGDNKITVNSGMTYGKIYAEGGNDLVSISGGGSENLISVAGGDDSVIAGGSNSTINVGAGNNFVTLKTNSTSNSIIAGNGDDYVSLASSATSNKISVGGGKNTVYGEGRDQTVTAGDSDDLITVGSGYIDVGNGNNDILFKESGSSTVFAGNGDDTVNVEDRDETEEKRYYNNIDVGDGNNYINNGNVELSTISAGSGNDTIITGGGQRGYYSDDPVTSIVAGAGDNQIIVNSGMTYGKIYAEGGNDLVSISGGGSENLISVAGGDDSVIANVSNSIINVGAGNNFVTLNTNSTSNSIIAGNGNDYVSLASSATSNKISVGGGKNTVYGEGRNQTVTAGDSDDSITVGSGYIDVGNGNNDILFKESGSSTVFAGNGDDTISVSDDVGEQRYYNYINAGNGNNYINNGNVENSTIVAGAGDDTIITGGGQRGYYSDDPVTSIVAGAGDNKITVNSGMTYGDIYAEGGNDLVSISGDGNYNIISVGNGRNTIITDHYYDTNYNLQNTIEAGTGSDAIYTSGQDFYINAGSGSNFVSLGGYNHTIITGKGNDTLIFGDDSNNNVIIFGGGNDIVLNCHSGDTVKSVGSLTQNMVGNDIILSDGTSNMTLRGAADKTINTDVLSSNDEVYKILTANKTSGDSILPEGLPELSEIDTTPSALNVANSKTSILIAGTELDDTISNSGANVTIDSGFGDDSISNEGSNSSILGGAGNDSITNGNNGGNVDGGDNVTINGGDGDDFIGNYYNGYNDSGNSENVSIDAGTGNDTIENSGNGATINGEDGNDFISNKGSYSNVTINGSTGNDTVSNEGNNSLIDGGAGDDYISNSGANVLFNYTSGDGNDVIEGFNSTSTLSISDSKYSSEKSGSDIIVTVGDNKITLIGAADLSTINIDGEEIFTWTLNGSVATYGNATTTLITVSGVKSLEGLSLKDKVVTVSATSLSQDEPVTISDGYELALGDDVSQPTTEQSAGWRFNGTTATYKDATTIEGYVIADNQIVYTSAGEGKTLVKVEGVISKDGLNIDTANKIVTVSAASLNQDLTVTVSDEYTLALGDDVPPTKAHQSAGWRFKDNIATYINGSAIEGYQLKDNEITYTIKSSGEIAAAVEGVKSSEGLAIDIDNKIVTVSAASLSQDLKVKVSEGYTLKFDSDVIQPESGKVDWTLNGTTAVGKISAATVGYVIENNEISYVEKGESSKVAVYGVKSIEGIKLSGTTVTISSEALNGVEEPVRISDGYKLALDENIDTPIIANESWTLNGNKLTYQSAARTAGYALEGNRIIFYPERGEEIIHIDGVKSKEGITRNGNTFTIAEEALTEANVTIDQNYSLALAETIAAPIPTEANWQYEGTTATYNTASTTAGYKLINNEIVYTSEVKSSSPFTVNGINPDNKDGLYFEDNSVTVYNSALNKQEITISEKSYALKLADEVNTPVDKPNWTIENKKATYQEGAITAGYKLDGNKIVYVEKVDGEIKLELDGIISKPTFADEEKSVIQIAENNIDENVSLISNAGGYKIELAAGTYSDGTTFIGSEEKETVTNKGEYLNIELGAGNDEILNNGSYVTVDGGDGKDKITNDGSNVEIIGGKGNDNVTLSGDEGGNIFVYSTGDGKDILTGFNKKDSIKIADSAQIETIVKGKDVVFKIGNGSITVKDGANLNGAINIIGSDDKEISSISGNTYTVDGIIGKTEEDDNKIVLATNLEEYTADNVDIADASQLTTGIKIDGGTDGISLIGGAGKDTLISGKTDSFELTGGKGNDVFVYKGGTGTIKDYSQKGKGGKDKIVTDGFDALNFTDFDVKGKEVILIYDTNNRLTIEEGADKEITFGVKSSTVRTFKEVGVFDGRGKAVTVASTQDNFAATKNYSKVETIDGSLTSEISITGNKKANLIIAGKGNSTLNGGKGNDTLVGGKGNDTFVYEEKSGNKLIVGYSDGDTINLGSGASLSEVKVAGNDLELKVGSNKITIAGGKDNPFTFNEGGEEKTYSNGLLISKDGNSASLTGSFSGTATDLTDYQNVSAELIKKGVSLTGGGNTKELIGGKGNDSLTAGSGGSSLWGGKGNDSLYGDDGADIFIFHAGDGSDIIKDYNFDEGDMLKILDKRGKESTYSKAVFSGDTLTLSIKGGGKVIFEGVSKDTNFNINGNKKIITGKTLK